MQKLPQELVDRIIDHVASGLVDAHSEELDSDWKDHYGEGASPEFASVASCGLVCKTWLPRSRFYLFSSTRLSNDYESGTDNLNAFLRLGDASPLPLPLSFIQFLDLDLLGGSLKDEDMRRLCNLPMLTSLRLRTRDDYDPDLDNFFAALTPHISILATNSPLLSSFHLDLNTDLPLPFLIHLVSNLPALEDLTIGKAGGETYDIHSEAEAGPPPALFPQLRTLDLRLSCGAGLFFAWLLSLPTLPIPRSLALSLHLRDRDFPIEASLRSIEEYLRRAGRRLESFSLSLSRDFIDESDYSSIDHLNLERRWLASANGLSALTLAPSLGASSVLEILSFLPSSRLSALTIVLNEEDDLPWGFVDQALSHARFKTLQRFAVEDACTGLKGEVSLLNEKARTAMPLAQARGILYSRFSVDYLMLT